MKYFFMAFRAAVVVGLLTAAAPSSDPVTESESTTSIEGVSAQPTSSAAVVGECSGDGAVALRAVKG